MTSARHTRMLRDVVNTEPVTLEGITKLLSDLQSEDADRGLLAVVRRMHSLFSEASALRTHAATSRPTHTELS
jgi:hypothetical protein